MNVHIISMGTKGTAYMHNFFLFCARRGEDGGGMEQGRDCLGGMMDMTVGKW